MLTVRYTKPAIGSPGVRDVTPAEMATKQAQPTTFSSKGPEYQVFERPYSTPSSPSCCAALSCARSSVPSPKLLFDADQPEMGFPETETINFANVIPFLFLFSDVIAVASWYAYKKKR